MSLSTQWREAIEKLEHLYSSEEAKNIASMLFEDAFQHSPYVSCVSARASKVVSHRQKKRWESGLGRLLNHEPVQYVLGYAWFWGCKFKVNEHVLIPRFETEELLLWALEDLPVVDAAFRVWELGTGSGILAISLAKQKPHWQIVASDVSVSALRVAKENASGTANIRFLTHDMCSPTHFDQPFDLMLSNPPYVPVSERLPPNVHKYEPHLALRVPEQNPLVFYHCLAHQALKHLKSEGSLLVEVHEKYASEVARLFIRRGFTRARVRRDIHGKSRMVRVKRSMC